MQLVAFDASFGQDILGFVSLCHKTSSNSICYFVYGIMCRYRLYLIGFRKDVLRFIGQYHIVSLSFSIY